MSEKNLAYKKILILRLSAIGDTIHTLPLAYAIKKACPECKIGWVVEDKAQLFINGNPLVDKCYVLPKKHWKKRGFSFENIKEFFNIINDINQEGYELVLDTQQLFKTAMILPFLKIKRKIALTGGREFSYLFVNEMVKASHKLFDPDYHVVKRTLELADYLGIDSSDVKMLLKKPDESIVKKVSNLLSDIDKSKPVVVIAPATTWDNKHWAEKNWIETISELKNIVNIVVTGTDSDMPLIKRLLEASECHNALVLAGKTNLEELAEVFSQSDIVVSPDSGSAHIAWAVSKPDVITVFTSTAEKRSGPFGDKCHVLAPALDCHPCLKKKCPRKNNKDLCKEDVKSSELINMIKKLLHLE